MDKLGWLFTAVLVLIGGAGVYAAIRTLRAIERQADLMERQATEARDSATHQALAVQASIAEATRAAGVMARAARGRDRGCGG